MHKSENTILIWVLTWAGLLLGLLYSPIGSPDLYKHRNYFVENQGVNFSGVEISRGSNEVSFLKVLKNATKSSSSYQDENADLNIPVVTANQATIWSLARRASIEYALRPRGTLFTKGNGE